MKKTLLYVFIAAMLPVKNFAQNMVKPFSSQTFLKKISDNDFVNKYVEKHSEAIQALLHQNKEMVEFMEFVLKKNDVPADMKCLALIESSLNNNAVSSAGAVGVWQLMPGIALQYGLKVDRTTDERKDIYKSTYVATKILKELYQKYGDWQLVVAAYNCGSPRIDNALAKTNGQTYGDIASLLPHETQLHVKKFGATWLVVYNKETVSDFAIAKEQKSGSTSGDTILPGKNDTVYVESVIRLDVISRKINMDIDALKEVNGFFEAANGFVVKLLTLPREKMAFFLMAHDEILKESIAENVTAQP
ncbi:transglycosylase SLT domain-containing protein [Chitinophagaceae bacterium 26-R-25]|nr:transglycosylase SLT domain-containing protein [Chitinophagaceae bacterium 26-R-25]